MDSEARADVVRTYWGPTTLSQWKDEVLASIVVCFAQIPESIAFAALAHVPPACGLHAAWIVGSVCALFGGRPGMINGSAGALATVTGQFVTKTVRVGHPAEYDGLEELFVSVILAGVIISIGACFNIGRFLTLVPATVMIGFCNGLAILIGKFQVFWFQHPDGTWVSGIVLVGTVLHCLVAVFLMVVLPKLTRKIPASLVVIIVCCCMEQFLFRDVCHVSTITVGEKSRFHESQRFPTLFFLDSNFNSRQHIDVSRVFEQGVILALVAILESLMTLEVMNDMTRTLGKPNKQVWAVGVANILAGVFGTMGGNSLIELSVMNVQAGGVFRASATFVSLGVFIVVIVAAPVLNFIPTGCLAGIMVIVVIDTAKWSSIPACVSAFLPVSWFDAGEGSPFGSCRKWIRHRRIQRYDAVVIVVVTVTTAVTNLAVAVFAGMFMASIRYSWEAQKPVETTCSREVGPPTVCTYHIRGNLFFAAKERITSAFEHHVLSDIVVMDFKHAHISDFSVLYAFLPFFERLREQGTLVRICNLDSSNHLPSLLRYGAEQVDNDVVSSVLLATLTANEI